MQRSGCLAGGSMTTYRVNSAEPLLDVTLNQLRDIDETESIIWTERILWPEAGMVIHHTVMKRAHVVWLEETAGTSQSLNPEGRSSPSGQNTAP